MSATSNPRARLDALLSLINSAARDAIAEYERTGDIPTTDAPHNMDDKTASLGLRKAIRILEGACEQLCTSLAPPRHTLQNRTYVQYEPACLQVVIKSNIAGILAVHPSGLPIADIGKKAGILPEKLGRILRFLATKHCFKEVSKGVFANNRLSSQLVAGTHVADVLLLVAGTTFTGANIFHEWLTDPEYGLSEGPAPSPFIYSIRDQGRSDLFDWLKHNPEWGNIFSSGMIGMKEVSGDDQMLVQLYPFPSLPDKATFCDVGGGVGHICMEVIKSHPNVYATLQDQPNVVEQGRQYFNTEYPEAVQSGRISFLPIDFLKEGPIKDQDIYYLRHVVHNWSDVDATQILRNIHSAMKPESRLLIQEFILWSAHQHDPSQSCDTSKAPEPLLPNYGAGNIRPYYQDINMMNHLNGKERSLDEFKALGAAAGLKFLREWDFAVNGILEFGVSP